MDHADGRERETQGPVRLGGLQSARGCQPSLQLLMGLKSQLRMPAGAWRACKPLQQDRRSNSTGYSAVHNKTQILKDRRGTSHVSPALLESSQLFCWVHKVSRRVPPPKAFQLNQSQNTYILCIFSAKCSCQGSFACDCFHSPPVSSRRTLLHVL